MTVKVTLDTRGLSKKISKLREEIDKRGFATADELGKIGKWYAKAIVPRSSGTLANSIRRRTFKGPEGSNARIYIEPYVTPNRSSKGQFSNFSLVRWMHQTGGVFQSTGGRNIAGKRHIKSGDPKFMYHTRDYLNEIKGKTAKGRFKNINIR